MVSQNDNQMGTCRIVDTAALISTNPYYSTLGSWVNLNRDSCCLQAPNRNGLLYDYGTAGIRQGSADEGVSGPNHLI
jgi:hypothetical protein